MKNIKDILKKENRIVLVVAIFCLIFIGVIINYTYSFFAVEKTNSSIIAGEAESMKLDLTVVEKSSTNNGKLIPQLDEYITSAVKGRKGSCIDDNNNTVCQVYKITLKNSGSSSVYVNGEVVLNKQNNPNLKWAILNNTDSNVLTTPVLSGNIKTPEETVLTSNELFTAGQTKNYFIVVWISETGLMQIDSGKFTGVVNFNNGQMGGQEITNPDITFASYTVDGTSQSTFPVGSYTVTTNCTDASVTFDYESYGFEISNIETNGLASCLPQFTTKTKVYLNTYIKDTLTGTTQGNGQVVNENGYRYEGKNPNNYIKFNNELWRIIGVFDENSHGQTGQYLTKIIRNDSIGSFAWDKSNKIIWPNSSLYKLLNNYYYTQTDGTDSGYCYKSSTTTTGNCDWTVRGINDYYRPMVKNVTWYLGGSSNTSATAGAFYGYERSTDDSNYSTNNRSYKTTSGYIGLMYASDYGYSVLSSSCARTTYIFSYDTNACAGNSWLYKDGYAWTITHCASSASYIFNLYHVGNAKTTFAFNGYASQPVLYLDSSVYIISGDGTESNPYIISM